MLSKERRVLLSCILILHFHMVIGSDTQIKRGEEILESLKYTRARNVVKEKISNRTSTLTTTTTTTTKQTFFSGTTEESSTTSKWNITELLRLKTELDLLIENTSRTQLEKNRELKPDSWSDRARSRFANGKVPPLYVITKRFRVENNTGVVLYGKQPVIDSDGYSEKVRNRFAAGSAPIIDPWTIPFVVKNRIS